MPKNQVTDLITDQEIAFAHMVLSGAMTDRRAAEAVGLNPDTVAYAKAKPCVQAYMLEHRAAMHKQVVQQETEAPQRFNVGREQVLTRLWEIANLSHEAMRNGISGQIKALSLIIAIEGLIPDRRAGSSEKKTAALPVLGEVYRASWLPERQGKTTAHQPTSNLARDKDPGSTAGPDLLPGQSIVTRHVSPAETTSPVPQTPASAHGRDLRVPYSPQANPYSRGR